MKNNWIYIASFFLLTNCSSKDEKMYTPVPYTLEIPVLFQDKLIAPIIPTDNPLTEEGVALGKKLFFDNILSGNETQSCATCHNPTKAFKNNQQFKKELMVVLAQEILCLYLIWLGILTSFLPGMEKSLASKDRR